MLVHRRVQSSPSATACERRERPKTFQAQLNAKASKLEHNSTMPAAVSVRNPTETRSSSRMLHLPPHMLVRIY